MIGTVIAVLLASLAYLAGMTLGLPSIVALTAALLVLIAAVPSGGARVRGGDRSRSRT